MLLLLLGIIVLHVSVLVLLFVSTVVSVSTHPHPMHFCYLCDEVQSGPWVYPELEYDRNGVYLNLIALESSMGVCFKVSGF